MGKKTRTGGRAADILPTQVSAELPARSVEPVQVAPDALPKRGEGVDDDSLYKLAWETRNFEIKLFWERSNYFLVLSTAIAVGFFAVAPAVERLVLGALGLFTAMLWWDVNLGSKFWQSRWEHRLSCLEEKLAPKADLFSATSKVIRDDVEASLRFNEHGWLRRQVNKRILKKPSVSGAMISLSAIFILVWVVLLAVTIAQLLTT